MSRIGMRLPFCLGAVAACAVGFLLDEPTQAVGAVLLGLVIGLAFSVDGKDNPIVETFHVFTFLGLSCMFLPQLVVVIPYYYVCLMVLSRTYSLRAFSAGLVGIALSCLAAFGVCYAMGREGLVRWWLEGVSSLRPASGLEAYLSVEPWVAITWGVLVLLALCCGVLYYARGRMRDKMRVRTLYALLFCQPMLMALAIVAMPTEAPALLAPMAVAVAPVATHYFSLRH